MFIKNFDSFRYIIHEKDKKLVLKQFENNFKKYSVILLKKSEDYSKKNFEFYAN